ncbi:MAG: hypothetical protein QW292_07965 [Candidatus Parvarchaeota archaeon]
MSTTRTFTSLTVTPEDNPVIVIVNNASDLAFIRTGNDKLGETVTQRSIDLWENPLILAEPEPVILVDSFYVDFMWLHYLLKLHSISI